MSIDMSELAKKEKTYGQIVFRDENWALVNDWEIDWPEQRLYGTYKIAHFCWGRSLKRILTGYWELENVCGNCGQKAPKELIGLKTLANWRQ